LRALPHPYRPELTARRCPYRRVLLVVYTYTNKTGTEEGIGPGYCAVLSRILQVNFVELRACEVRRTREIGSDRGNCTGGYSSSTNSFKGTPYALAIFVTVGM
jgi:hypothetical protein